MTVRLAAAMNIMYQGRAEAIDTVKKSLGQNLEPNERKILEHILATGLAYSDKDEDFKLVRRFLIPSNEELKENWQLPTGIAFAMGISQHPKALEYLQEAKGRIAPITEQAIEYAMQWQRNKNKQPYVSKTTDSDEEKIFTAIKNACLLDKESERDINKNGVIFNSDKCKALTAISIGNLGFYILSKKQDDKWTVVGLWYVWIS